jgi:hypothetical protein
VGVVVLHAREPGIERGGGRAFVERQLPRE